MSRPLRILISAGEASGDRLGAGLARALRARHPGVEIYGMGGDEMREAGVRLVQHASEVAVVGVVEVVRHLPAIRRAMQRLEAALDAPRPDLVIPIDFPDFNLRFAARARAAGVPVVYYVSPQVWAWRKRRVTTIRDLVRRVLVLFPFETAFYEAAGVPATFVGHPAAASRPPLDAAAFRTSLGLAPGRPLVALLPGSRVGETSRVFPVLLEGAKRLAARRPDVQFVVPRARTLPPRVLEDAAARSGLASLRILEGAYPGILEAADAGAVASGTATLDAALAGLPFVAVYRMQPVSYWIARALVTVDHIALPNLVAGERIVPELVQGAFTPEAVAAAIGGFLDDPERAAAVRRALAGIRARLAGDGAFDRAAVAVLEEAGRKSGGVAPV